MSHVLLMLKVFPQVLIVYIQEIVLYHWILALICAID